MDLLDRNRARRAALDALDPDERRALALDRLLSCVEGADGGLEWSADFGVEAGPDFPWVRPRPVPPKRSDRRFGAILDGGGLKILARPGIRELGVREVRLLAAWAFDGKPPAKELRGVFHAEELAGVTRIDATGVKLGASTKLLATAPHLGALRELEAIGTGLDLQALAAAKGLPSLSYLGAGGARGTADDLVALLEGDALPALDRLAVDFDLATSGTGRWSTSTALSRLRALRLVGARKPSGEQWRALLANPHLSGLRHLDLGPQSVEAPELGRALRDGRFRGVHTLGLGADAALLDAPLDLPELRTLSLYVPDDATLVALCRQPFLPSLEELHLGFGDGLTGDGLDALFRSARLGALRKLALRLLWGAMPPAAVAAACRLPASPLTHVALLGMPVGPEQVATLLEHLPATVEHLRLDGPIGADGARRLAASERMAGLKYLQLPGAKLGAGVRELVTSPHLRTLQALHLDAEAVDEAVCEGLLSGSWPRLVDLRLRLVKAVGDATRRRLAAHENMPELWVLTGLQLSTADGSSATPGLRNVAAPEPGLFPYDPPRFPRLV